MTQESNDTIYTVVTQHDENGDVLLPIPEELLKKLGWKEGDDIEFGVDDQGRFTLKKKD